MKNNVRRLMDERGLTNEKVALGADLTILTVRRWAKNEVKSFDAVSIGKLCKFFGVRLEELIVFEPEELAS